MADFSELFQSAHWSYIFRGLEKRKVNLNRIAHSASIAFKNEGVEKDLPINEMETNHCQQSYT